MQSRISISGLLEPFILRKALSTSADNSAMRRIPSGPVPSPPGTLHSSLLGPDKDDRDLSSALHTDTPCGQSQTLGTLYGGQTECGYIPRNAAVPWLGLCGPPQGHPLGLGTFSVPHLVLNFPVPRKQVPWLASTACCWAGLACPNHSTTFPLPYNP